MLTSTSVLATWTYVCASIFEGNVFGDFNTEGSMIQSGLKESVKLTGAINC